MGQAVWPAGRANHLHHRFKCRLRTVFDHGVDVVAGTQVIDPDLAMRCVGQGATFRQVKGRRPLTMAK